MCGISGFIDHHQSPEQAKRLIDAMLEKIAHRGPDARSVFVDPKVALGHNRLSIIDLSEEGTQPMHYFDAVIVFNGEIYNYIELKKELQAKGVQFKTDSDTEVVLAAYRTYGTECVQHFVGMWAFAIWDKLTSSLFCSRDRFGIKPFNYILEDHRFYFASEYKALKEAPIFKPELNMNQVYRGLQLGWISYDDETYYKCIQSLPAACNMTYSNGNVRIEGCGCGPSRNRA